MFSVSSYFLVKNIVVSQYLYLIKLTQPKAEIQLQGERSRDTFTRWATKPDAMQKKREAPN
ncbi:hypothetical protein [Aneurinibacillus migulanus]|uniref:hypothetical protein n=1 Tax=Aneurinibacillus migulanus TaxID=47500 RepID=UPI000AE2B6C2|nr:hypothetical protein [Aneurinibacillus migulanus]